MSATGRKKNGDTSTPREALNHYPTPPWCTRALVKRIGFSLQGKHLLECAAGDGAMLNVLAAAGAVVDAVELDKDRAARIARDGYARQVVCGDFLDKAVRAKLLALKNPARAGRRPYDVVASNPPYGEMVIVIGDDGKPVLVKKKGKKQKEPKTEYRDYALEFAETAIELAPVVAFLLRVHWIGSIGRVKFHEQHPADLVVLANRPKFTPGSGGDGAEYAWWIWREGATVGTWVTHFAEDAPSRGRPKNMVVPAVTLHDLGSMANPIEAGGKAAIAEGEGRTSLPA